MRVIPERSLTSALASPKSFTGRVWRTNYIEPDDAEHLAGARFMYEPGARSFWHIHEQEQAIIAVYGTGIVAWEGLDVPHLLAPGDWWHVSPGVLHWHGATPDSAFAHLAVTAGGATLWRDEVNDATYAAAFSHA